VVADVLDDPLIRWLEHLLFAFDRHLARLHLGAVRRPQVRLLAALVAVAARAYRRARTGARHANIFALAIVGDFGDFLRLADQAAHLFATAFRTTVTTMPTASPTRHGQ